MLPYPEAKLKRRVPTCWMFLYRCYHLLQEIITVAQSMRTDTEILHRIFTILDENQETVDAIMSMPLDEWTDK